MQIKHPTVSLAPDNYAQPIEQVANNHPCPSNSAGNSSQSTSTQISEYSDIDPQVVPSTSSTLSNIPSTCKTGPGQTQIASYIPKRVTPKYKQIIDEKLIRLFTDSRGSRVSPIYSE
ncbi:unnamed protein product [Callosobruchus maculatus]|uniref:Uncharacterized protein n=1 Tax=Callosobruchus maculatus TaxID=64391 RepID=A0A653D5E2_CALMS|nr:unnamed protein product [Callosobruchus maculatus]